MKKRTVLALGISICTLALSASVLSTVAWFDGSSVLQVSNFNITLANKELKISVDNETFKEVLTKDDLMQVDKFIPVSSMFSSSWIDSKAEKPTFKKGFLADEPEKTYYVSENEYAVADKGFFSQTLYLKSDSTAYVTVDPDNIKVISDEVKNNEVADKLASKYPEMSHEEIVSNLNKVKDSLRFSLLVLDDEEEHELDDYAYYIIDPHKNGDTYLGSILDNNLDGFYDHYDGKEVLFGEAKNVSSQTLIYKDEGAHHTGKSYSVFDASTKQGVKHLDLEASMKAGLDLAKENSLSLEQTNDIQISLTSGVSKRIVLSFYLEGWDRDNTNLAMYSHFFVDFSFKLASGGEGGI